MNPNDEYRKGMEEWVEGCKPKPDLTPNQLRFYEYKWIRQLLMDILEFRKKNGIEERPLNREDKIPYCIYKCSNNDLKKIIDKMTNRMKEFEPWLSKNTTAHCGYWEV